MVSASLLGHQAGYALRTACQDRPGELPGRHLKRSGAPLAFLAYWKRSPVGAFMTVNAHFDGRAIIPDEPLDLRPNQALIVQIEPIEGETEESALAWIAANAVEQRRTAHRSGRSTRSLPLRPP